MVSASASNKPNGSIVDINYLDLYAYNLSDQVLESLKLLFFDSTAQLVQQPTDFELPDISPSNESIDLASLEVSLPQIVQPKALGKKENLETIEEQDNHDASGSDDSESEEEEDTASDQDNTDHLYQRVQETYTIDNQTSEKDTRISYLNTRSAQLFFESSMVQAKLLSVDDNQHDKKAFSIYKSLFDPTEITNPIQALHNWKHSYTRSIKNNTEEFSALFMIGGGHFAGAIVSHKPKHVKKFVKQNEIDTILPQSVHFIDQKSFHRYTTRRKQGGSQSAMDNAKGKANSAGSSLRRYNEKALASDVKQVIKAWKPYLQRCKSIFIKANTQANFKIIVSGDREIDNSINKEFRLYKNDSRIKHFPFSTARPTTTELKKAWIKLTYLTVALLPKIDQKLRLAKQKEQLLINSRESRSKSPAPQKDSELSTPEAKHTSELVHLLKKSKAPALIAYLRKQKVSVNFVLQPESKYHTVPTLLHYAADNHLHHMVYILLNNLKADPTIVNKSQRTAWDMVGQETNDNARKQTRYAFQKARYRLGEKYCDWQNGAHMNVPGLSDETIAELEESLEKAKKEQMEKLVEEEKKRIAADAQEQVVKKHGAGYKLDTGVSLDREIMRSLSDEDRRRLEREKRARAVEARLGIMRKS